MNIKFDPYKRMLPTEKDSLFRLSRPSPSNFKGLHIRNRVGKVLQSIPLNLHVLYVQLKDVLYRERPSESY